MVVETDGYLALIEHLTMNLDIFAQVDGDTGEESIEDVVTDLIATNIIPFSNRTPNCIQAYVLNC